MSVRSSCLGCTAGRAVLIAAMIAAATSPAALAGCARESDGAQPGDALPSDSVLEPDGARGLDDIHQSDRVPAFPGAEGFGAFARGGRGGDVLFVTNLDDYQADESPIEGSLRLAIEAEGPRTVLFRVSGNIDLSRPLEITEPYLTIAGQSAPGDGITLKNYGIDVAADDVVIRYLRVRPGDVAGEELDAINIRSSSVIVDHCSASWATDETISVIGDATNVTVQWCIIAESLNESVHRKGEHGYGSLISTPGNVSIHHNIYALHKSRNPRPRDVTLDFRHNLIFGWGDRAGYNGDDAAHINYVGNLLLPLDFSRNDEVAFTVGGPDTRLFVEGNVLRRPDGHELRDWELIVMEEGPLTEAQREHLRREDPFDAPPVQRQRGEDLLAVLMDRVGATRPARDAVDRRILKLIRNGAGEIIDSQAEVGGWPHLASASPPVDADEDGMPDAWELEHGLDPSDGSDHAADLDGDGYTNLEEYLNQTDPAHVDR